MSFTTNRSDVTATKLLTGTYTASGTTQAIATGLQSVEYFNAFSTGSATSPRQSSISGGTVTITVANNDTGYWMAKGI